MKRNFEKFFCNFFLEAAALPPDSSSVSDKNFPLNLFVSFFFIRQEWLTLGLFLLIKMIKGASFKIFKEL